MAPPRPMPRSPFSGGLHALALVAALLPSASAAAAASTAASQQKRAVVNTEGKTFAQHVTAAKKMLKKEKLTHEELELIENHLQTAAHLFDPDMNNLHERPAKEQEKAREI